MSKYEKRLMALLNIIASTIDSPGFTIVDACQRARVHAGTSKALQELGILRHQDGRWMWVASTGPTPEMARDIAKMSRRARDKAKVAPPATPPSRREQELASIKGRTGNILPLPIKRCAEDCPCLVLLYRICDELGIDAKEVVA